MNHIFIGCDKIISFDSKSFLYSEREEKKNTEIEANELDLSIMR